MCWVAIDPTWPCMPKLKMFPCANVMTLAHYDSIGQSQAWSSSPQVKPYTPSCVKPWSHLHLNCTTGMEPISSLWSGANSAGVVWRVGVFVKRFPRHLPANRCLGKKHSQSIFWNMNRGLIDLKLIYVKSYVHKQRLPEAPVRWSVSSSYQEHCYIVRGTFLENPVAGDIQPEFCMEQLDGLRNRCNTVRPFHEAIYSLVYDNHQLSIFWKKKS